MTGRVNDAPILVGQTGPLKGERWSINKVTTIGRETTCQVVIPDRQVSRVHARLTPTDTGAILEDLESKNGIHYNGQRITGRVKLKDGDVIQIALAQQFLYLTSDATIPLMGTEELPKLLQLDLRTRSVYVDQQEIDPPLSALQFKALKELNDSDGQVVDRLELINRIWGEEEAAGVSDQALDALLRRLRERIAEVDPDHGYIFTLRGHGVTLRNPTRNG